MTKFGRFGPNVSWQPGDDPGALRRLHDPGKPSPASGSMLTISKTATETELAALKNTAGWVRTWSELNRAVLRCPSATLPPWHVLESTLPVEAIPDDAAWSTSGGGLSLWHKWGITPSADSADSQWVQQLRHWVAKRHPHRNGWDRTFYFATPEPPREVFAVASLSRSNDILAFDTNGAYSYAVANVPVPDPAKLSFVGSADVLNAWNDPLLAGVYRVRVTIRETTPDWWRTHHPLVNRSGKTVLPVLWPDEPVETFIHSCERDAWLALVDLEPLDGVVARGVPHALSGTAKSLWAQRVAAEDTLTRNCAKWLLSRLHTAVVPTRYKNVDAHEAASWWKGLGCEPWTTGTKIPDIDHSACQWSSAATVSAWARGNWLRFVTALMAASPEAVPAYTNVDSFHVILPRSRAHEVKAELGKLGLLGAEWGQWRLQAHASKGVWLGLGKYWLVDASGVLVLHQNLANKNPWASSRRWCRPITALPGNNVGVTKISQTIWNTLPDHSELIKAGQGLWIYRRPTLNLVNDVPLYQQHKLEQLVFNRNRKKRFWYLLRNIVIK